MGLAAAFLWAVAGVVAAVGATEDLGVPPLELNGSESQTSVLLMRQEIRLEEIVILLMAIRDSLQRQHNVTDVRDSLISQRIVSDIRDFVDQRSDESAQPTRDASDAEGTEADDPPRTCPSQFQQIGRLCLHLASSRDVTWADARVYCQDLGGDLVSGLWNTEIARSFVQNQSVGKSSVVWVGGHDRNTEGHWEWLSGDPIPKHSTLWGRFFLMKQPSGGNRENCACLYGRDKFNLHDIPCNRKYKPLCQVELGDD